MVYEAIVVYLRSENLTEIHTLTNCEHDILDNGTLVVR